MVKRHLSDSESRERALDPARSFIVQAPAGSGKTELLVRRYLQLLKKVKQPEEILAITFTRKAAAELRLRILKEIPAGEIAHRLRIQTIDAFCASLTRQMPVLARFGGQPEIVEDASELYLEAARRALAGLTPAAARLLAHLDNNVGAATGLLAGMLARRDQWLRKTGAAPTRAELENSLVLERNRLLAKAKALHPKASEELAREVLTQECEWRKKPRPAPPGLAAIPGLREALCALRYMPPAAYTDAQWQVLEAILALLKPALAELLLLFGERGQVDFTQVAHGALLALGTPEEPTDLLLSLDYRIRHILVDEFQDTSVSQWELLDRLTAGWEEGDGRTVFIVGDPMQSIYRWRDAVVGLFLHARREGLASVKLEPLTLQTNFRSQESLVSWFNAAFPRILPAEEDEIAGAVPYSPAAPHHPALPGEGAAWHHFPDRDAEASQVIRILSEATGKSAILVRNRSHLDHIVPALQKAGIRFRAVEIEQLGEKQVVQDLYALTRAISHPADRIAWLSILRAPWCGLLLEDLSLLAESSRYELVWDLLQDLSRLSPDGRARAARLRDTIAPVLANRLRGSLRERVEGAWLALAGPACVEDATELEDAEIFLDELERLEQAGDLENSGLLAERLQKLYALPDVEAGPDAVEIMTIHKAKGLQWDSVIVPGLDRTPRSGPKPLFAWKALAGGLLLAPINETGTDEEPMYNYVRDLDKDAEDIEAGRLFYVAATRAKSRLHLLACIQCDEHGDPKPPATRSLLAKTLLGAPAGPKMFPIGNISPEPPSGLPDHLRRLPSAFSPPATPAPAAWRAPPEGREEEQIEFSWAGETARHVGTVVHRWLQRIAEDELHRWDGKRVESLRVRFMRELERRGVPSSELKAAGDAVAAALSNTLADERGRWVLGPHAEARSEQRMRVRTPEGTRTFVMDRVFRDADGMRWVVDYKTSRHEGADLEAFLDQEGERYAPQLASYAEAIAGSRQGLYFPLLRGWRER